ncbi:MAG: PQQ-binding-like beta-propeller repeat protein [Acidobacteriota bacterium]|nr:PQQ-binding-like beta-propeller repeat protein [Blastocatellia bacterium]MDW8240556.1 PQQ-binding-like beta-propeller repeat protein [Acidobacteriota bacterium]
MSWFDHWTVWITLALAFHQSPAPSGLLTTPFVKAWSYLTTDTLRYNGAVADSRQVFAPLRDGQLMAFERSAGEQAWAVQYARQWTTGISMDEQTLYLGSASSASDSAQHYSLLAVDKQTGRIRWEKSWPQQITAVSVQPATADSVSSRLYLGDAGGFFTAIDPSSQQVIWQVKTEQAVSASAREHEGIVYTGSDDGRLYALDARTGAERWRFSTHGPVRARVEISPDRIFVGSFDGSLYCLERGSGRQRWRTRTGAAIAAQPLLIAHRLIVCSYDNFAYALDSKSGAIQWKTKLSGRLIAEPIRHGDSVLVAALRASNVMMLRVSDGQLIGSLELGKGIELVAAPVMTDTILVMTTDRGIIAARLISN